MQHLAARGINCPLPVAGRDGSALRMLCGRHAAITTFLPGVWPRRVHQAHCRPLGEALAPAFGGADFQPARRNALGPDAWAKLLASCRAGADSVQHGLMAELQPASDHVLSHWPKNLPTGHIHADLFPDNVFFLDGQLSGLIDFYFACTDLLAYDIAVCLNAWCFEPDFSFNVTRARACWPDMTACARSPMRNAKRCPCWRRVRRCVSCSPDFTTGSTRRRRAGHPQEPAGLFAPPALSSRHEGFSCLRTLNSPAPATWWKSGPMAAANPIPAPAAGAPCCAFAALNANSAVASPTPPITAWNSPPRPKRWRH
jgi:hypothetical protein